MAIPANRYSTFTLPAVPQATPRKTFGTRATTLHPQPREGTYTPVGPILQPDNHTGYEYPNLAITRQTGPQSLSGDSVAQQAAATPSYPVQPASLSPSFIAWRDNARAQLAAAYQQALANQEYGRQSLDAQTAAQLTQLARQANASRQAGLSQLSNRGLALSPGASGRFLQDVANARAAQGAQIDQQRAAALAQLRAQLAAANRARVEGNAAIARQAAAQGANLSRLLPGVYA